MAFTYLSAQSKPPAQAFWTRWPAIVEGLLGDRSGLVLMYDVILNPIDDLRKRFRSFEIQLERPIQPGNVRRPAHCAVAAVKLNERIGIWPEI